MEKIVRALVTAGLMFTLAACSHSQQTEATAPSTAITQSGNTETSSQKDQESQEASSVPETTTLSVTSDADGKTLIVYFSWSSSGNTEKMADQIQEQTGGDLLKLEPVNPYPTDYQECGDVAKAERDENARPEISNLPESIADYDTIFVGYPIWWHTAPMIIGTFLDSFDLNGVEVYPFSQSASMDTEQFENSMGFVRENADGANVHDGLFVNAEDTNGIQEYLTLNGFAE